MFAGVYILEARSVVPRLAAWSAPAPSEEVYRLAIPLTTRPCYPIACNPSVTVYVVDASGSLSSLPSDAGVRLVSDELGILLGTPGDPDFEVAPGQFKFESPTGDYFGQYTVQVLSTLVDNRPLSPEIGFSVSMYADEGEHEIVLEYSGVSSEEDFVPELGTAALLGTGLAGLLGYAGLRYRKRG